MKLIRPAIILTLLYIVVTGIAFPLFVTAVAQATMPAKANGSLVARGGKVIGSELVGQGFSDPKFFHPRPSAAGSGYDANNSGGTNLGPTNPKLLEGTKDFDGVKQLSEKYRAENGLSATETIPVDAVTRSASGLDPHISPENANLQANRIARVRGISVNKVKSVISQCTDSPVLGIFGDSAVNVLKANLALEDLKP